MLQILSAFEGGGCPALKDQLCYLCTGSRRFREAKRGYVVPLFNVTYSTKISCEVRNIFEITVKITYNSGAGTELIVALNAAHGASVYGLLKCFLTKIKS